MTESTSYPISAAPPSKLAWRQDVEVEGVPYVVNTNLEDAQIVEVYSLLLTRQFFVGLVRDLVDGARITVPIKIDALDYLDGACLVALLFGKLSVAYRTHADWARWNKWHAEKEAAERRAREREEQLRRDCDAIVEAAQAEWDKERYDKAERLLLRCREVELAHLELRSYWRADRSLFALYGDMGGAEGLRRGLAFVDAEGGTVQHYQQLASWFEHRQPGATAEIYRQGIGRHPDAGHLYQALSLLLARMGRVQEAIEVCREAVFRGLADGTKSGFAGRIERLMKRLSST